MEAPSKLESNSKQQTLFVTKQFRRFSDDYTIVQPIREPRVFFMAYECYKTHGNDTKRYYAKQTNKAMFGNMSDKSKNEMSRFYQNKIGKIEKINH